MHEVTQHQKRDYAHEKHRVQQVERPARFEHEQISRKHGRKEIQRVLFVRRKPREYRLRCDYDCDNTRHYGYYAGHRVHNDFWQKPAFHPVFVGFEREYSRRNPDRYPAKQGQMPWLERQNRRHDKEQQRDKQVVARLYKEQRRRPFKVIYGTSAFRNDFRHRREIAVKKHQTAHVLRGVRARSHRDRTVGFL